ncbi:glycosyltransferase [Mucilaginibacter gilvus]|uniref:Glycosyltransferase family 1 protein n=1 Tax=Mucilaginibacter gilvus TaxID=2305909 RepID=A0A3S3YQI6_9SPHI|nr:glycosyltransferase [Mucilaginibacter gilvus]RWY48104.1 glycosyltransferase family 1 protein [Mucilaginibacter gilvus]
MTNPDKIKVLHISQVQGGIETYIEQIITNIDRNRFEVMLACPAQRESIIKMVNKYNVPYINLEITIEIAPLSDLKSIIETIKLVRRLKPDIIHAHSSKAGMTTRLASIFFKPKVFYTPNAYAYLGQKGLKRKVLLWIEKLAIPFTDFLLAASQSEARRSKVDVGFPDRKVVVYPNSIEILPQRDEPVVAPKNFKMITMVGRLVDQKNPMMFLRVCKLVTDLRNDIRFQIVGAGFDDKWKDALEQYIAENHLEEKINILSWKSREELLQTIRETDVFVMTSMFESFGYVVAEAQMLQVPVVATNVDGLNEIIQDGVTGYLIEVDDDQSMADKILAVIDDSVKTADMVKKGRERVSDLFDIKTNIKILEQFYTENSL